MHALKRAQKDKVRAFVSCTGATDSQAVQCLSATDWRLDAAADFFFMHVAGGGAPSVDSEKVNAVFDQYKEANVDEIQIDGLERLCNDLGVEPTDPVMLMLAWKMKAKTMCVFTREEWSRGLSELGCESIDDMKGSFPDMRAQLDDDDAFRDYYCFCFGFAKEPGACPAATATARLGRRAILPPARHACLSCACPPPPASARLWRAHPTHRGGAADVDAGAGRRALLAPRPMDGLP